MEIGIVGGGIAGLYTALLLKQQGHSVTVFEAKSRLGGRIFTHYFKTEDVGHLAFFEAGAMRIPLSPLHACVFEFVRYVNEHNAAEDKVEFIPYVLSHHNNKVHLQGRQWDCGDRSLAAWMELPVEFHNMTAGEMMRAVMNPWLALLNEDFEKGMAEVLRYDELTFRQYLHDVAKWPHQVIDFVELVMSQTNQYDQSFTDLVLQTMHFSNPGRQHPSDKRRPF